MIAHVKLGTIQIAIQSVVLVHDYCMCFWHVKLYVIYFFHLDCGDNKCNSDETCESCSIDCCSSFPDYAIAVIVIAVVIIALVAILLPSTVRYCKQNASTNFIISTVVVFLSAT